jgi:hypothetical protein
LCIIKDLLLLLVILSGVEGKRREQGDEFLSLVE